MKLLHSCIPHTWHKAATRPWQILRKNWGCIKIITELSLRQIDESVQERNAFQDVSQPIQLTSAWSFCTLVIDIAGTRQWHDRDKYWRRTENVVEGKRSCPWGELAKKLDATWCKTYHSQCSLLLHEIFADLSSTYLAPGSDTTAINIDEELRM